MGARCARCSASVRPGAPWCTQCYAPAGAAASAPAGGVATPEAPEPEVRPAPATGLPVVEPVVSAPLAATSTGTWPCSTCSHPNDLALPACGACGTPFLAAVRDDRPTVVLPVVGDVLALSAPRRVALALGAVVVLLLLTCVLALLLA